MPDTPYSQNAQSVLDYWFGPIVDGWPVENRNDFWWEASVETDAEISTKFGGLVEQAIHSGLPHWRETPRGMLANIILLDQFTRNIYRRTPKAFSQDETCRQLCLGGMELGFDQDISLIERVFFYMPLMHSEQMTHQDHALKLYQNIVDQADETHKDAARRYLKGADVHRDLIVRFGRFPHRNHILKRANTQEEQDYLDDDALTFGQA